MTTVVVDHGASRPVTGFTPKTMAEELAGKFDEEADFYLYEGRPYVVYGSWDYAECWGPGSKRQAHPYLPAWRGTQIPEAEFRALVKTMHAL